MTPGGYIAQVPLTYFQNMSLDLFPGKLLRGRVISSDGEKTRIEIGGAQLAAKTSRLMSKGDTVTLKVTSITKNGVSFEIVDIKSADKSQSEQVQQPASPEIHTESKEASSIRQAITRLMENPAGINRSVDEALLTETLRTLFAQQDRYDFFFLAFPVRLDDEKTRMVELLLREVISDDEDSTEKTREFLFLVSTPRLGDISGKVLTVGNQMRVDLIAHGQSTASELESLSDPIKVSLAEIGYQVTSVNIRQGAIKHPIEWQIAGDY